MRALLIAVLAACVFPQSLDAYLHFTFTRGAQTVTLKWGRMPIRWFARDRSAPGVPATELQAVAARAFATWQGVSTASLSSQFVGFTGASPFDEDGISVIGFDVEPDDLVLGETGFLIDVLAGEIVEADILINSAFQWSTTAAGDPTRFDLESVVTHEVGHFLGLGHSALGETELRFDGTRRVIGSGAVMFPISFGRGSIRDRELQPDDIAGISDLYPAPEFRDETGIARGRVVRGSTGVIGAHVVAFHPESGDLVSTFTLNEAGEFEVAGLRPGPHVIRVEPLDDADLESFFDPRDPIDLGFLVTFHNRFFVAPRGATGDTFTVTVRPR